MRVNSFVYRPFRLAFGVCSSRMSSTSCLSLSASPVVTGAGPTAPVPDATGTTVRILALHGKGSTGPSFSKALEPLESALAERVESSSMPIKFVFDYPTAPYSLGNIDDGRAWWTLAEGERSFTAREYIGYDASAKLVEEKLCEGEGFDFVLGHSQGAILLSALLATSDRISTLCDDCGEMLALDEKNSTESQNGPTRKPIGFIFNGSAIPNPYKESLQHMKFPADFNQEALFIIGSRDTINPPEGAKVVRDALKAGGMTKIRSIVHSGGHSVPVKDQEALGAIADWIIHSLQLSKYHCAA